MKGFFFLNCLLEEGVGSQKRFIGEGEGGDIFFHYFGGGPKFLWSKNEDLKN